MDVKSVCLCVLALSLQFVRGQNLTSPCPSHVFDGVDNDIVQGKINLLKPKDESPVSVLDVRINFTVAGPILNNFKGTISPRTSNLVRKYNQGQGIEYRVVFSPSEVLPKVTALIINGETICQGSGDELGEHTSSFSLRHKSKIGGPGEKHLTLPYESGSTRSTTPTHIVRRQTDYTSTPRPVTNSIDNRVHTPITTDECGLVAGGNEKIALIHNGLSYERGEIPWLVAIYRTVMKNVRFICGGTLVSDRHVVTAAHCMSRLSGVTPIAEIFVKVGVHRLNDWSDDFAVIRKVMDAKIYEEYNSTTLQNDILILILDKRVTFNQFIRPVCLWSGDTDLLRVVGDTGVVAGWGDRDELYTGIYRQEEPQMARLPIVSTNQCRASKAVFHHLTYNNTLCAGARNGVGPCVGDSGGGLYLLEGGKWRLRGVVSVSLQTTHTTCDLNEYVVLTDSAQFLPWIRNILSVKYYD